MKSVEFSDGIAVNGDCCDLAVYDAVKNYLSDKGGEIQLICTDPPYGNIVKVKWDKYDGLDTEFVKWMSNWTRTWNDLLVKGGAFYVWGGLGRPGFRPFFKYLIDVETENFQLANLITWGKKRAYGVQNNYLYTREELAYFVKGNAKRPRKFNVPLLDNKRGYAGYNKEYPAKSEFYRRTNVWSDVTEIFRGKVEPTQKPQRVIEIPIEIHTDPGEFVLDMFAGSGTTAQAARSLGRRFVVIEKDEKTFDSLVSRL